MRSEFIVVLCAAAALAGCSGREQKSEAAGAPSAAGEQHLADGVVVIPPNSPKLREIHVDAVQQADVPFDEVVSPGKIEVNPNLISRVMLPVPGRMSAVLVKIGDAVRRGEPLLTIESPDADAAESAYRQAEAALTTARANSNKAEADYDRASDLFDHNAVAKKDVLTAENALAQAKAAVDQVQAALDQAQRRLALLGLKAGAFGQKVTVSSSSSGKVLDMTVAPGEYHNDTNSPVMTIADLSTVWVSSDVPESQIRFIDPGERIDVTLTAYPGETFHGRVTRIADTVDPQTRTIKVRAELDNAHGRLRPEMFGTIRHIDSVRRLPVVPAGALVQEGGRTMLWAERANGRFEPIEVKTAERVGDRIPVLSGVKAGDRIVVDGAMLLRAQ
jgi:cobalt-zinc-cadmium efflux system membrane fusion protein